MICPNCKKEIDNDSKFCEFCGNRAKRKYSQIVDEVLNEQNKKSVPVSRSKKWQVFLIAILVILGIFIIFWFGIRPIKTRSNCSKKAFEYSGVYDADYERAYKGCLRENFIKE